MKCQNRFVSKFENYLELAILENNKLIKINVGFCFAPPNLQLIRAATLHYI